MNLRRWVYLSEKEAPYTDKPFTTKIKSIVTETPQIRTIFISYVIDGKKPMMIPGQFIIVWIPGMDEIPMAVSYVMDNGDIGFTVRDVGEATQFDYYSNKRPLRVSVFHMNADQKFPALVATY